MAYVPPHKRHFKDADRPTPVPDSLVPQFRKNVNLRSPSTFQRGKDRSSFQGPKIVYASSCISRWWPVGSTDNDPIPESFHLECIPCEPVERERGEKPLVLVDRKLPTEANKVMESSESSPWLFIAEKVQPDLLATLQNVKIELESQGEEFKPSFVARFGKIFFHGGSSMSLDIIRNAAIAEANSRNKLNKSFYTHVPSVYLEEIEDLIVPRIGFDFNSEKEQYHVKIFDKSQPDVTISCKCTITEDHGKLEMYKAELNQVRHLVEDISCLYKDLDLRLMLWNKRILMDLDDAEKVAIGKLIEAAVVAPDAKGGLRWPLGKESAGDRFSVIGVWHTKYRAFKNPSMKLKLRHADRFDFRSSKGEVSNEATLKMTTISRWLRVSDI
uniref:CTP synthase n=1 Tax=Anthurium amnicola TaxID=1678845 RepID=A0A1D1ZAY0_9ARAE